MSENKLQDVKAAEGFVDHTLKRLQKSFRITVIATIAILVIESIYFLLLTDAIGSGLKAYSEVHVEQYRDEIDNYLFDPARRILPEIEQHNNDVTKSLDVPKSLEIIVHHLPDVKFQGETYSYSHYSNEVAKATVIMGKINDWVENEDNYTNRVVKVKKMLGEFNEKTKEISDKNFAEAKQIISVFNKEAKNSPEKFAQLKEMINRINEPEDIEGMANLISQKVVGELDTQGYMISTTASDYLKENLDALPEWVEKQIPQYGARLRHEANTWIDFYCKAVSDGLGETFDAFLDDNADKIKEFTEKTDDDEILDKLDEALTEELVAFMEQTSIENYGTLKDQSDRFLKRLKAANELLAPLASKKSEDLTDHERRLRHAVALFVGKMKQ